MRASGARLNLNTTSVATLNSSRASISQIDQAINKVSSQRGDLGAWQNRLAFTISFTENAIENIQNSEASISDADIDFEISRFTRAQVLSQASTTRLAQANVMPQLALQLLNASSHEGRESRIPGLRHVHTVTLKPRAQRRTTAWRLQLFFQRFPDASFPFSALDFSPSTRNPTKRFCPSVFR